MTALEMLGHSLQTARVARGETLRTVARRVGLTTVDVSAAEGGACLTRETWKTIVVDACEQGWNPWLSFLDFVYLASDRGERKEPDNG